MATAKRYPIYKYVLATIDWWIIVASYALAFMAEARWWNEHIPLSDMLLATELAYVAGVAGICVFIFHYLGLYQINVFVTIVAHIVQITKALAFLLVGTAVLSFFSKADFIVDSRLFTLYLVAFAFTLLICIRVCIFRVAYLYLARNKVLQRNVLIVGAGENGRNVAASLFLHDYIGLRVVGFLDDEVQVGTPVFSAAKVVGKIADMAEGVKALAVKEILICLETVEHTKLMELMERTMPLNVIVKVSSPLYEIVPLRRSIEHYGNVPVLGVFQSGMTERKEMYKRTFDIVMASIMLLVLSPMFAAVGLLIKLDSPGPVFFRQVRIGKNGKRFKFYKFRSMTVGADKDTEREKQVAAFMKTKRTGLPSASVSTKIVNEARVTPIGKWLRKLSIDEFPQLINVLKGEMSLVGPRPCLPFEWEQYEEWHKRRLSVLPGLTGMWQVAGRSVVGFDDMVVLDLHYIQNASLILDLRVMLKTIPVMLFGLGTK